MGHHSAVFGSHGLNMLADLGLTVIKSFFSHIGGGLAAVGPTFTDVSGPLALIGHALTLIGHPLTLISGPVALICALVTLIGEAAARLAGAREHLGVFTGAQPVRRGPPFQGGPARLLVTGGNPARFRPLS